MRDQTGIEWTNATWNPVTGCSKVSTGCDHCYAESLALSRLRDLYIGRDPVRRTTASASDPFSVRLWPERLDQPLKWSAPRMVFVNSMSDLFHNDVPEEFVRDVFEVMLSIDWHIYQVLTKRPSRATRFWQRNQDLFEGREIPSHVWLGASIENQRVAYRADHLRRLPAKVRFLSCEPLLGPLRLDLEDIHWVIAGGESGPDFRHMEAEWAGSVRDQSIAAGVPFFFKQVGGRTPKAGGRLLDGRLWSEYPFDVTVLNDNGHGNGSQL